MTAARNSLKKIDGGVSAETLCSNDSSKKSRCAVPSRKWAVLAAAYYMTVFLIGISLSLGVLFYEKLVIINKASATTVGWLISVNGMTASISSIVAPALVHASSFKTIAFIGSLLASTMFMLIAFFSSTNELFILYGVFMPLGSGIASTVCFQILPKYFVQRRGLAMGILTSAVSAGGIIIPRLLSILQQEFTLFGAILITGALLLNCCLCALAFKAPKEPQTAEEVETFYATYAKHPPTIFYIDTNDLSMYKEKNQDSNTPDQDQEEPSFLRIFFYRLFDHFRTVKNRRVLLSSLSLTIMMVCNSNLLNLVPFTAKHVGHCVDCGEYCITASAISNTGTRLLVAIVADKEWFKRRVFYILGPLLAASSTIALSQLTHDITCMISLMLVYGVGMGLFMSLHFINLIQVVGPELYDAALSVNSLVTVLANLSIGPLLGLLKDHSSSYSWSLLGCALLFIVPVILQPFIPPLPSEEDKKEQDPV